MLVKKITQSVSAPLSMFSAEKKQQHPFSLFLLVSVDPLYRLPS